jgi:hypothetical protein
LSEAVGWPEGSFAERFGESATRQCAAERSTICFAIAPLLGGFGMTAKRREPGLCSTGIEFFFNGREARFVHLVDARRHGPNVDSQRLSGPPPGSPRN